VCPGQRIDGLGQVEDLPGEADEILILPLLALGHLPLLVRQVPARVSSWRFWVIITNVARKMASSDHDHREQPVRVSLDLESDPRRKPDDVDIHKPHRAGER
jgi:hypothetical protein